MSPADFLHKITIVLSGQASVKYTLTGNYLFHVRAHHGSEFFHFGIAE